jgi:hypothetical protein
MSIAWKTMDRQEATESFFKGEIFLKGWDMSGNQELIVKYEPDKFLYHIDDKAQIIRIPKGGWSMMDAIVPEILEKVAGPIVEIGMGESTRILTDHAYQNDRKLYSCDIQMGGMFTVFDKPLFDNHICFIGRSEDFIKQYDGDDPAVVFIDGEHTYETVKVEIDFFLPRLRVGGVIFMHDTFPQEERLLVTDDKGEKPGDIYKVRQELERNPEVDVLTWPYTANNVGLTMVLKHKKDREFWLQNGRLS